MLDYDYISSVLDKLYSKHSGFALHQETGLVIISGTDCPKDWLYNLDLRKNELGYHKGFYRATQVVLGLIQQSSYVVVGHSLAGAIASILKETDRRCTYALGISTPNYTRIKRRVEGLNHIVSNFDLVCRVPLNYTKNGERIYLPGFTHNHNKILRSVLP